MASTPFRKYGNVSRGPRRLSGKARRQGIVVSMARRRNAAGRNSSALECERNCGMVYLWMDESRFCKEG